MRRAHFLVIPRRAFPIAAHLKVPAVHFREQRRGDPSPSEALYAWWSRPRAPRASRPPLRAGRAALPAPPSDSTGRRFCRATPARHVRCLRNGRAGLTTPEGSRRPESTPLSRIVAVGACSAAKVICQAGRRIRDNSPYPVGVSFRHLSLPSAIGAPSARVSEISRKLLSSDANYFSNLSMLKCHKTADKRLKS